MTQPPFRSLGQSRGRSEPGPRFVNARHIRTSASFLDKPPTAPYISLGPWSVQSTALAGNLAMSPFEVFIMPSVETLNRFVARVEANAHIEAVEEFYAEDSWVREPN